MIKLHSKHAEGIKDGMRRVILLPGDGEQFAPREIVQVVLEDERILGYVLIRSVQIGSVRHWIHEADTLSVYGCAHAHELVDKLKQYFPEHKFAKEHEPWVRLGIDFVDEWQDSKAEEMGAALWKLKFKVQVGKKM